MLRSNSFKIGLTKSGSKIKNVSYPLRAPTLASEVNGVWAIWGIAPNVWPLSAEKDEPLQGAVNAGFIGF